MADLLSVYSKFLLNTDEIRNEAIAGAVSPIPWIQSLASLCDEHGVKKIPERRTEQRLDGLYVEELATEGVIVPYAWDILLLC